MGFEAARHARDSAAEPSRSAVLLHAIAFVVGFTLVFVIAGASASALGAAFAQYRSIIARASGVVVVLLGLNMLGVTRIPALAMDRRMQLRRRTIGCSASLLTGIAFAAGWTPCVGPILAGVLALAGSARSIDLGVALLAVYSLGLAVPFLLMALALRRALPLFARIRGALPAIEFGSSLIVTAISIVLVVSNFGRASAWLYNYFPALENIGFESDKQGALSFGTAFVAGLASFVSPCVLPLMPAYLSMLTGQSVESLATGRITR
jgi:cytochrome c-type biogenesis protein